MKYDNEVMLFTVVFQSEFGKIFHNLTRFVTAQPSLSEVAKKVCVGADAPHTPVFPNIFRR
ncbi:MAG: hypothetical protein AB1649_13200, partial [Chloroflexota bacterium]